MSPRLNHDDIAPVSYTHLDVYKRQELLGEFDDEDTESLQTALDDIQNTNSKNNAETPKEQGKPLPQEIKK